jgi:thiol-disulfide isomerase/thioredoxin
MRTLGLAALLALAACSKAGSSPSGALPTEGEPTPFELPDMAGKKVKLSDFAGKVVLLDFWATWCPPCVEETPDLVEIHSKYAPKGFTIVGVAIEEASQADVADFIKSRKVPYPILYAEERPAGYKLRALPTAYLIDRKGRIRMRYLGEKDPTEVRRDIEAVLAEDAAPAPAQGGKASK